MIDDKNIIRYLDGEMPEDEKLRFEEKMSRNPELARKVKEIRKLQELAGKALRKEEDPEENLDQETRDEIRQSVDDFKEEDKAASIPNDFNETIKSAGKAFEEKREKSQHKPDDDRPGPDEGHPEAGSGFFLSNIKQIRRIWFTAAAVVVIAVIASILILRPFADKPAKDLYAEYFKAFPKTEEMTELSRADNDLMFAIIVYEAGDYERAAILFEMLADSSRLREYSLLYAGNAYMHLNRTDKAIETFQELLADASDEIIPATRWYMALCYVKLGDPALSREQLELILETDSPFRKDARMLLRDLQ